MLEKTLKAQLILENGMVFEGRAFGHAKDAVAEIVFVTSMVGYQEILSDPSFSGKIVMMTYPLIGNAGINLDDNENLYSHVRGLIVREKCDKPNNWRCEMDIDGFLKQNRIVGIEGIDTRAVMGVMRKFGAMKGIISIRGELDDVQVRQKFMSHNNASIVREITCIEKYTLQPLNNSGNRRYKVGMLDMGLKQSLIQIFLDRGNEVVVYPATTEASTILADKIDGLVVGTGAGNPEDLRYVSENVEIIAKEKPVLGVGLGFNVLCQALGGENKKLQLGLHGDNYPVKDINTCRIYVTTQNTSYVVDKLPPDTVKTFAYVNDDSIQGFKHTKLKALGVQFCPEGEVSTFKTGSIIDQFENMMV